jgi:hypothetical protein
VSLDGVVNLTDAALIVRAWMGFANLSADQRTAADGNADGKIDILDARSLLGKLPAL